MYGDSPLLRPLDRAGTKRPIRVIQDEAFGVLQQAMTVSLQLVGLKNCRVLVQCDPYIRKL
jgi:hypothetical protein